MSHLISLEQRIPTRGVGVGGPFDGQSCVEVFLDTTKTVAKFRVTTVNGAATFERKVNTIRDAIALADTEMAALRLALEARHSLAA